MKFDIIEITIGKTDYYFIIINNKIYTDKDIAEVINIPLDDYIKILENNNTYVILHNHYFKNKEDTEKTIEKLESILVMKKLTEELI